MSRSGVGRLSQDAGAANPTTLALAHASPDPEFLSIRDRELEAVDTNHATPANLLGFACRCPALWKEQLRVDTHAVRTTLPGPIETVFEQCLECHVWAPPPLTTRNRVVTRW